MGARKKEISKVLLDYLNSVADGINLSHLSVDIGCPIEDIRRIFDGRRTPSYKILVDILDWLHIDSSIIINLMEKDSILLYKYWEDVYKEEAGLSDLKCVIKEEIHKREIDNREIIKHFNVAGSFVSAMLSGQSGISYNCLVRFAEALDVTPKYLLDKLKGRQEINRKKVEFTEYLSDERKKAGWTIEDASALCKMSIYKYLKIENAETDFKLVTLIKIAKGLRIDYEKLGKIAIEARLLYEEEEFYDVINKGKKIVISKGASEKDVEKRLCELSTYKNITMNSTSYKATTVITLIFLILYNDMENKEKYKNEIIYYLNELRNGNDNKLYAKLDLFNIANSEEATLKQIFLRYKEEFNYSFLQVAKLSGYSKGYISNKNQSNDFGNIEFISRVFPATNIPISIGIELLLKELNNKSDIDKNEDIAVHRILMPMKDITLWLFRGEKIELETLRGIFTIIYGTGDAVSKYEKLKELKYPVYTPQTQ